MQLLCGDLLSSDAHVFSKLEFEHEITIDRKSNVQLLCVINYSVTRKKKTVYTFLTQGLATTRSQLDTFLHEYKHDKRKKYILLYKPAAS